jgi:hypothetical protein
MLMHINSEVSGRSHFSNIFGHGWLFLKPSQETSISWNKCWRLLGCALEGPLLPMEGEC